MSVVLACILRKCGIFKIHFLSLLIWFDALKRGSHHIQINHFQSPNYLLFCDIRPLSIAGVGLYVKSDSLFCIKQDVKVDPIENIWIETEDMIIDVIYKPHFLI